MKKQVENAQGQIPCILSFLEVQVTANLTVITVLGHKRGCPH